MPSKTSTRAPLALILFGLITGLILAQYHQAPLILVLPIALGGGLTALLLSFYESCKLLWTFIFIVSATVCFWAYGSIRLAPKPSASDLEMPQREAQLKLSIQTVVHVEKRYNSASAICRVLDAPKIGRLHDDDLIYVQLELPEAFFPSETSTFVLQKGLRIQATGILSPIPKPPGSTSKNDFNHYLKSAGVYYKFNRTGKPKIIKPPPTFVRFCASMNQRFQTILQLGVPENSALANIYVTMLLGNNAELNREQRERYRTTGTLHFFAISGLHIGVIAAVIAQFLLLVRIPQSWSPWIGLPLLYLYVEITGASPSAMRAFLMAAFFWLSFAVHRQHASFAALVNSAIVVLLINPNQLWNLGFQLSYAVVASILLFGLPISQFLKNRFQPYKWLPKSDWALQQQIINGFLEKIFPLFAISFSAWLASLPLCAVYFGFIVPAAIVINTMLVCLVTLVIIAGVLSLGCGLLSLNPVSEFINHAAWLIISVMDGMVRAATVLPNISFQGTNPLLGYSVLAAYFLSLCWLHYQPDKLKAYPIGMPTVVILSGMIILQITSCS